MSFISVTRTEARVEFNGRKQQSVKDTEDVRGCCSLQMGYHREGGGGRSTTRANVPGSADSSVFKCMIHFLNAASDPGSGPTLQDKQLIGVFVRPHE